MAGSGAEGRRGCLTRAGREGVLPGPGIAALIALLLLPAPPAAGLELGDGLVQVHGFYRQELRVIGSDFEPGSDWYVSQWAHTLDLELEFDLAPEGIGPFDAVSAFARVEFRFDCVWTDGCGVFRSRRLFGDEPSHAPSREFTDAVSARFSGILPRDDSRRIHGGSTRLISVFDIPPLDGIKALGAPNFDPTFADLGFVPLAAARRFEGTIEPKVFAQVPWQTGVDIDPEGPLRFTPNLTPALPLRPAVALPPAGSGTVPGGLFLPSPDTRRRMRAFDPHDQNLRERELRYNHGSGQDEHELKELYVDLDLLDGSLFVRAGKQTIVWGKTELFRNQDQWNPQDLALSSLPSLEESRLALFAVRAIWSLYTVGPFEDVRLELAAVADDFEPADLGRCGEPYTVFLVCAKSAGLLGHGILGIGIAGERRPPKPWNSLRGVEVGGRVEFRWDRFSFALTDFYGFSDFPHAVQYHLFERRVDPETGRPLDVLGQPLDPSDPDRTLALGSGNRQYFDVFCSASVGLLAGTIPELAGECALAAFNSRTPLTATVGLNVDAAEAVGTVLAGDPVLSGLVFAAFGGDPSLLVTLNRDPGDGAPTNDPTILCAAFGPAGNCLMDRLTPEQEALLGCGPFYGTHCDRDGLDLFNLEGSVLFQSFPGFERDPARGLRGPVATRFVEGRLVILPGARGPGDPGYDPRVDGCTGPEHPDCAGAAVLVNPRTGERFPNELAVVSWNFVNLLANLGTATDPDCRPQVPESCSLVRILIGLAGVQHPDLRAGGNGAFGRRDLLWHSGGEIELDYEKRNVLGFAMDFAEDRTGTSWGLEFSWTEGEPVAVADEPRLFRKLDLYRLTVSVDRPTFVRFLNPARTFFVNLQLFVQYAPGYRRRGLTAGNGPITWLSTITATTGYFQDRLLPFATWVHDWRSASGGLLAGITYRYTSSLSISVQLAAFYGGPQKTRVPIYQTAPGNNFGVNRSLRQRTAWNGLSAISERDEIGVSLRYTF